MSGIHLVDGRRSSIKKYVASETLRNNLTVMENSQRSISNLYPLYVLYLYLQNMLNERNFSGVCGHRQRQGLGSVLFSLFRIYILQCLVGAENMFYVKLQRQDMHVSLALCEK